MPKKKLNIELKENDFTDGIYLIVINDGNKISTKNFLVKK